jgi:LuxR family transcriptional regulator, maltose regulon positive regulatory protein
VLLPTLRYNQISCWGAKSGSMPKAAQYAVTWAPERAMYEFRAQGEDTPPQPLRDDTSWFAWLAEHTGFAFHGEHGAINLLKEARARGEGGYWYAYQRQGTRMAKRYAGRNRDLTFTRLEAIAGALGGKFNTPVPKDVQPDLDGAPQHDHAPRNHIALAEGAEFDEPLLATKFHIPRLSVQHIPRERLVSLLDDGDLPALTIVAAPAGSGKTTLLAEWATAAHQSVAWLSLEAADDQPERFLSYLIAAMASLDTRVATQALAARDQGRDRVLAALINAVAAYLDKDAVLILDDYHVLTSPAIQHMLMFLVEHLPSHLHMMLGTRTDPPLPLARLRVRGQLREIRADELRFSLAEVEAFLLAMGITLDDGTIQNLEQRTEGWIAGVQLAALALRGRADPDIASHALSGNHRYLLDFVSEEILTQQTEAVRSFLLHTGILEQLNGSLCDAMTGHTNGREMLAELRRANLFISALDDAEEWYRYHALFADALRSRLQRQDPALMRELYRRASVWFEQQQQPITACDYALLAQDFPRAAALMDPLIERLFWHGEFGRIGRWLTQLPQDVVVQYPLLLMRTAWMALFQGQFKLEAETRQRMATFIAQIDQHLQAHEHDGDDPSWIQLRTERTLMQSLMMLPRDDPSLAAVQMQQIMQQIVQSIPPQATRLRHLSSLWLKLVGSEERRSKGNLDDIERELGEVIRGAEEYPFLQMIAIQNLIEVYEARGQLQKSFTVYQTTLARTAELPPILLNWLRVGYANLLREWNRLDEAQEILDKNLAEDHPGENIDFQQGGVYVRVALYSSRGQYDQALDLFDKMQSRLVRPGMPSVAMQSVAALRARLALAAGKVDAAYQWARTCDVDIDGAAEHPHDGRGMIPLSLARIWIARGRSHADAPYLAQAIGLLDRMLANAERAGYTGKVIELLMLKSLALQAQGKLREALDVLGQALELAEPGGYIRLFGDEGVPMARLLARVAPHTNASPIYVQSILAAVTPSPESASTETQQSLLDPLSGRELEVLRLLATGASNQAIAAQLVIAPTTVKRHVKHILAKLTATNRTQAVTQARVLGLV